jgi:hypothetical protein
MILTNLKPLKHLWTYRHLIQLYLMSIVVIFIRPSYQKGPNLSSIFKLISTC